MEVDLEKTVVHRQTLRALSKDCRSHRQGELTPTGEITMRAAKLSRVPKELLEGIWEAVLHLDLRENELQTIERSHVVRLTQLRTLDLRHNRLEYLPDEIGGLLHLRILRLDCNLISSVPRSLWQVTALETLTLSCNSLFALPPDIQHLTRLKVLVLAQNRLLELPPEVGELPNLETFHIHGNEFPELPVTLSKLKQLKELSLEWFRYTSPPLSRQLKGHIGEKMIESLQSLCVRLGRQGQVSCTLLAFLQHFSEDRFCLDSVDVRHKSALHLAAMEGDCGVIKGLLDAGIEINSVDKDAFSAFGLALHFDKMNAAKLLLSQEPDINTGAGAFGSPLHIAVCKIETWLVRDLLRKGADPSSRDKEANTPLHLLMSVFEKSPRQCILIGDMLLHAGAAPNPVNSDHCTPLHLSLKRNQTSALRWALTASNLLSKRNKEPFNVSAPTRGGLTPLHIAAHIGNYEAVMLLLGSGKIHALVRSEDGLTPRQVAKKDLALLKVLFNAEMEKLREQRTTFEDCSYYEEEKREGSGNIVRDKSKPLSERYAALYGLYYSRNVKEMRELVRDLDPSCPLLHDLVYFLGQLNDFPSLPTLESLASSPASGSQVLKDEALNAIETMKGKTQQTHVIRSIMGPKLQRSEQLLRNSYSVKAFSTFSGEDTQRDHLLFM